MSFKADMFRAAPRTQPHRTATVLDAIRVVWTFEKTVRDYSLLEIS
jgi:hypothetical protein